MKIDTILNPEEEKHMLVLAASVAKRILLEGDCVKYADFFDEMVRTLGNAVRPYVAKEYFTLQVDMDVPDEILDQMDDGKTVRAFDPNTGLQFMEVITIDDDTTDDEDEDEDEDEEYEAYASNYATKAEMKAEAIKRMRSIHLYEPIIEEFEEEDLPQVYEPPYGASYALEEDELESVRNEERARNILIWGVIRCFMMMGEGNPITVDCMLHVSPHKNEWEQERQDLLNGCPYVYTQAKEINLHDHGCINIYMSEGGTPLRH